ncbi:MAG: DUF362 domain-containing protein [Desulfomonilaceae bacterium]
MTLSKVAVAKYTNNLESLRKCIDLSEGFKNLPPFAKVFIKPNIVLWSDISDFPKWGMITTSRMVEDVVTLLAERGVQNISIGEAPVLLDPRDKDVTDRAFAALGYRTLRKRYGVKLLNLHRHQYERIDIGEGLVLNFSSHFIDSDFVINIPVLKTHSQTVVSLGIKNLKGVIDIKSRQICHSGDPKRDLHYMVARLADALPDSLTVLDGIYTNERGPGFDGKMRRSNLLAVSRDVLAADKVGAMLLGHSPSSVPYLVHAAANKNRPQDLADVEVIGSNIDDIKLKLQYEFPYNETNNLPLFMAKRGIKGVSIPKPDTTLCTYCFTMMGIIIGSIAQAWEGKPWEEIEVLTGKIMRPKPGMKKTVLIGKCMYQANKDNPAINYMIAIKTCPPSKKDVVKALKEVGIPVAPRLIEHPENAPGLIYKKYIGNSDFDESFFTIQ